MYKIKRHKLLNLYYVHDRYCGPITDEYEFIEEVEELYPAVLKVREYHNKRI